MISNDCLISQTFIDQLPGLVALMDEKSRIIMANQQAVKWLGFSSYEALLGKTYFEMPCKIAEEHEIFASWDKLTATRKKTLTAFGYYCYANEWKIILAEKYPIIDPGSGQLLGIMSHCKDITKLGIINCTQFLEFTKIEKTNNYHQKQASFLLEDKFHKIELTKRQFECLFFLIRGKTSKEIAKALKLSPRTIDFYLEQMKYKLNCSTRSQLIEVAIMEGYMNIIPKSLLRFVS